MPLIAGSPTRLTFSPGADRTPAWLPDGSGILYSFERLDRPDRDRCLALLPGAGGTVRRTICARAAGSDDSTDVFETPGPAADGRLLYVRASSRPGAFLPQRHALVMGTLDDPAAARVLRTIPYTLPGSPLHLGVADISWLGPNAFVYLAEFVALRRCRGCAPDTVRSGLEIVRVDLVGDSAVLSAVPGTRDASSVAVGDGGAALYYTIIGDSRVFRRAVGGGAPTVAHDFGVAGIARDVAVAGDRLSAVVGGDVTYGNDPAFGYIQLDFGGNLRVVDLLTGSEGVLPGGRGLYRRPAFSPDGRRIVAEGVQAPSADLWLFQVP